jgi:hypothetical protein
MRKMPPLGKPVNMRHKKIPVLDIPKADNINKFRQRYPNADAPHVHILNAEAYKSTAYNFVSKQVDLMRNEGLSEEDAFRVVETRYLEELDTRTRAEARRKNNLA